MRALIRAAILAAGAIGFALVLASVASADVVEPKSAYQPASVGLLDQKAAAGISEAEPQAAAAEEPKAAKPKKEEPVKVVEPTPAPEQVVRPALPAHDRAPANQAPSPVDRIVHPLRTAFHHFGASLGRAVSACEVGGGPVAGGPVLVLAVLAMAVPFTRRRVLATRRTADEDVPEFLYVWELTPPG